MKRKACWLYSISICCSFTCIIIGSIAPVILSSILKSTIAEKAVLNKENNSDLWGTLPGKSDTVIFQHFHFFNIENPDDILWKGSVPKLTEKNGYIYQEFDTFEDLEYSSGEVAFFNYRRVYKSENCIWSNFTKPTDIITTLNVGSLAAWYQLKTLPRNTVALLTLYQLVLLFDTQFAGLIYTAGVSPFLGNLKIAQKVVFEPAGISEVQGEFIWKDPFYGMGNIGTLVIWVEALMENTYNETFCMPQNLTGALYTVYNYFGLSLSELESIMSGQLLNAYNLIALILFSDPDYNCSQYNSQEICDPSYLGALQWSTSLLTLSPPGLAPIGPSITSLTNALVGYPEMNYYLTNTTIGQKYPDVSFSVNDYGRMFTYNKENGFPIYDTNSFLDVGRMNTFFALAASGNFSQLAQIFNLTSENHARVMWDYLNALVDNTALQGRSDPNVYNFNNRGIMSELGLGTIGSQSLSEIIETLSFQMPLSLTAAYDYLRITYDLNTNCSEIMSEISPGLSPICEYPELVWQNNTSGFENWVAVYWYGLNSSFADYFLNVTGINNTELSIIFENSKLTKLLAQFDLELMQHYNCQNAGLKCSGMLLAVLQWGQSFVTLNLPEIFSIFYLENTTSVVDLPMLNPGFTFAVEYSDFAYLNGTPFLEPSQSIFLLSQLGFLTPSILQQFFIYVFELNYAAITSYFKISEISTMANYLRHMINDYFFEGIFKQMTVEELLWTNSDPIIATQQQQNPLLGGNPSLDPTLVRLGLNQTREQWEYVPPSMKSIMNSGSNDINHVRNYKKYLGADYANILMPMYFGEGPNGPVVELVNYNPWAEEVKLDGGDGWFFHPDIQKSDVLPFYFDPVALQVTSQFNKTVTVKGYETYRFTLPNSFLANSQQVPGNAIFYQFGPNGLLNETSVLQMPLFVSKPYFLDGDPVLNQLVQYTTPQYNVPTNYDSYFDSEYHTGIPLYLINQLQFNVELKSDALYPNLGLANLQNYGYNTYMPVLFNQRSGLISDHSINTYIKPVMFVLLLGEIILAVGITAGLLILITLGLFVLRKRIVYNRQRRKVTNQEEKQFLLLA